MFDNKKWQTRRVDADLAKQLAQQADISELTAALLIARNITDERTAKEFLYGKEQPFYPPNLLKDMQKATTRILAAIERKEKITIYGDYDVDGITSIAILHSFFKQIGYQVDYYIPQRKVGGYGLNSISIEQLYSSGTTLLITVDCGISALEEVSNAPEGLDIIITDHHNPPEVLPKACAIINPKQLDCSYPFKHLAGVGVAFKLCQGLWQSLGNTEDFWQNNMDLVALGTIADVVSLTDENREIVKIGLENLKNTTNLGLSELMKTAKVQNNRINTSTVGFVIAPRLNAAGRLDEAKVAVELLTTCDSNRAKDLAEFLELENAKRQQIEKEIFEQAQEVIVRQGGVKQVLVLAAENWHIGVIGIVASRLVDKYNVPVIMISITDGVGKASCRSIDAFDMYQALNHLKDYLLRYGGHHQAAGFSIAKEKIDDFYQAIINYAKERLQPDDYIPVQKVDFYIEDISKLDLDFVEQLQAFAPHGMGNPMPSIVIKDVVVQNPVAIGQDKEHLKFKISKKNCSFDGLFWRKSIYKYFLYDGLKVDIAFIPQINCWHEKKQINLHISSVKTKFCLYDFRLEYTEYLYLLFSEIANCAKTIYVYSKDKKLPVVADNIVIVDKIPNDAQYLVFWDAPYEWFLQESLLPKTNFSMLKRVFLLYNKNTTTKQQQALCQDFVDNSKLKNIYKDIAQNKMQSLAQLSSVYNEAFLRNALEVLQQIGAINIDKEKICVVDLPKGTKLDLHKSALYNDFFAKQEAITKAFDKSLNLAQRDFVGILTTGAGYV